MSIVAILSPTVNVLDNVLRVETSARSPILRRPCPDSESDSPPIKKLKKAQSKRKKPKNSRRRCSNIRNKPVAPFNTTQFLMADHNQLKDSDFSIVTARPRRHRDSSVSMDSDIDDADYYSSPENEEEFLTKEFWAAYEDVHAERLDTMTKAQLVQEYLALEERVDYLERQLRVVMRQRRRRIIEVNEEGDDDDVRPGEVKVDEETAEKIEIFRQEIRNLEEENLLLRGENQSLKTSHYSSSSSSSSSSSDESSSDEENESEITIRSSNLNDKISSDISTNQLKHFSTKSRKNILGKVHPDSGVSCGCGSSSSSSSEDLRSDEIDPPSSVVGACSSETFSNKIIENDESNLLLKENIDNNKPEEGCNALINQEETSSLSRQLSTNKEETINSPK